MSNLIDAQYLVRNGRIALEDLFDNNPSEPAYALAEELLNRVESTYPNNTDISYLVFSALLHDIAVEQGLDKPDWLMEEVAEIVWTSVQP